MENYMNLFDIKRKILVGIVKKDFEYLVKKGQESSLTKSFEQVLKFYMPIVEGVIYIERVKEKTPKKCDVYDIKTGIIH